MKSILPVWIIAYDENVKTDLSQGMKRSKKLKTINIDILCD